MPNLSGKGYYRWSLSTDKLSSLLDKMSQLSASEKYSIASMLAAKFKAGCIDVKTYIDAITPFAGVVDWDLVTQPVGMIKFIAKRTAKGEQQQALLDYLSELYQPVLDRVALKPNTELDKTHPNDAKILRQEIDSLMSVELKQPDLLKELVALGVAYSGYSGGLSNKGQGDGNIHPGGIDPDTIGITLLITHTQRKKNTIKVYEWGKSNFDMVGMLIPKQYLLESPLIAIGFCSKKCSKMLRLYLRQKLIRYHGYLVTYLKH